MTIPAAKAALLAGKRGLIVGIANQRSIAWGCAKAFRALGAELAVTYVNDKTRKYVEPLAREIDAGIVMPMNVQQAGQLEAVFARIAKDWGRLDFLVHSIASAPKETLRGRVVDASRDGFLQTMDISCWSFIRMVRLAEPLMKNASSASLALTGAPTAATSRRAPANTAFLIWIKCHATATASLERESFARHRR
jgi:enoyl-[acyl-carrier protein] reductase I